MKDTVGSVKPVTVTLTLEEWTAILGRIDRPEKLSPLGKRIYKRAATKLGEQIVAQAKS